MMLLCLKTEVYINWFANSLPLHLYDADILSCWNQSLLQSFWGELLIFYCDKHWIKQYPEDLCWQKMEMVDILFILILPMIRFFVCIKKGPLFLFKEFLNITIMGNLLNFMVLNLSCSIIHHTSIPSSSALTCGGQWIYSPWCIDSDLPLRSHHKLSYTYCKFCSTYPYIHPIVGSLWWLYTILNSALSVDLWLGKLPSLMNKSSELSPLLTRRVIPPTSSTIRSGLWTLP